MQYILDAIKILKPKLLLILFPSLIIGGLWAYFVKAKVGIYTSQSKIFPLQAEGGGDPLSSIKAQFGVGGGGGGDLSKYYNVNELVNSNTLSRKIVQYPTKNSDKAHLYDWIIEDFNKLQFWKSKKIDASKIDSAEKIIIASNLLKNNTTINVDATEFTSIRVNATEEKLALRINECVLQSLADFYINSKTEKARKDLNQIGYLKDSLKTALDIIEKNGANFADESQYLVKEVASLPRIKLERLHQEVEEQYKVTASAFMNANFKLLSESPIFQILDKPTYPCNFKKESWIGSFVKGTILGLILFSLLTLSKFIYNIVIKEIMPKDVLAK